ncbi:MAG: hypothetical protein ACR2LR_21795 [Hassallia sp.]
MSDDKPFGLVQSLMGETPLALASPFGRRPRCFTALRLRTLEKEVTALPR